VSEAPAPEAKSGKARFAFLSVVGLHVLLLFHFAPPRVLFSKDPVVMIDYALHTYQVDRALTAWRGWGKLWGWDPFVLAGQPAGVAEDLTSKGTELFIIGLRSLGVHAGFAFNLFIFLVLVLVPFAGWASARLFGLDRRSSVVATLLWVLLWYFDSFMHWSWWLGMITWCFASYASVLLLALMYRAFESKRAIWYLPTTLLAAVLALVHPFAALSLVVPGVLLYARSFRELPKAHHALLGVAVLSAAATTLVWIGPALRFWHYVDSADTYFNATLDYLFFDTFDLMRNSDNTGAPVRTALRTLAFVAGAITLVDWRRKADRRTLPIGAMALGCLAMAYLAAHTSVGRQTQPYRQIAPAMLAAALPAGVLLSELTKREALSKLDRRAKILIGLAAVLFVPRLVRTFLFYFPNVVPSSVASQLVQNEPKPWEAKLAPAGPPARAVREWLETNAAGKGRIVVQPWVLGEYLAAATRLPLLGGLEQRNIQQADAHLFRRLKNGDLPGPALHEYLSTYAVSYIVLVGEHIPLEDRKDELRLVADISEHRIYRTTFEPSWFMRGQGRLVEQRFNALEVDDASGDDVVLRFHWLETLRCRPDCKVEREPIPGDRVGFIRVPNPPKRFEIYNAY
jgi:hypothetical protein